MIVDFVCFLGVMNQNLQTLQQIGVIAMMNVLAICKKVLAMLLARGHFVAIDKI